MEWNIAGHEWAAHLLQEHIRQDQVRHAYLFTGPPGVGRRTLALRFAQAISCTGAEVPGQLCGVCKNCQQIWRMQHPDLSIVQAETEGGVLKVDQIRSLQHTLSLSPFQAPYRIALLLRFHESHPSAANALLKTLEEAPPRVILLLTADTAEGLLPTIVSRCEVLRLRPMSIEQSITYLKESQHAGEDKAALLAHLSGGRAGYAERLMSDGKYLEQREVWLDDMVQQLRSPRRDRFTYAERNSKDKDRLRQILLVWLSFWRDVLLTVAAANVPLTNIDRSEEIRWAAGQVDLQTARKLVEGIQMGLDGLDSNLNSRLLAEVLLLDWPRLN